MKSPVRTTVFELFQNVISFITAGQVMRLLWCDWNKHVALEGLKRRVRSFTLKPTNTSSYYKTNYESNENISRFIAGIANVQIDTQILLPYIPTFLNEFVMKKQNHLTVNANAHIIQLDATLLYNRKTCHVMRAKREQKILDSCYTPIKWLT